MKKLLIITILALVCKTTYGQEVLGDWHGVLKVQGMELRMIFHIKKDDSGNFSSTFDSPDQGSYDMQVTETTFIYDTLTLTLGNINGSYKGLLKDGIIEGKFKQSGFSFNMNLTREEKEKSVVVRPQDPVKPYPYNEREVEITSVDDVVLSGTLTIPKGEGPFPAVILISGSGAQDRNEEIMNHRPFLVIADYFTRNGIAVMRYDDRGFAKSTGDHSAATTLDFANDAEHAFLFLQKQDEINKDQIGFAGHSEGGLIAPVVAARNKDVAFIISMAGPGISGLEILKQQIGTMGPYMGLNEGQIKEEQQNMEETADILKRNEVGDELKLKLRQYLEGKLQDQEYVRGMSKEDFIDAQVRGMNQPWYKYFIIHEPSDYLAKVDCPILAINGNRDVQVAPSNLEAIKASVADMEMVTVKEYEKLNHLFQKAGTGLMNEYALIEETISEQVLQDMVAWMKNILN